MFIANTKQKLIDEYCEKLSKWNDPDGDIEIAHQEADGALCKLLIELGFGDVVEAYDSVPKWYA